jgi:acetyl-CoA carboxylase alpha subunit
MAKPEGYRKAIRLMQLADKFGVPVVTLVDTPGAFPGVQAEERGQAEAIARSTEECLKLGVPIIADRHRLDSGFLQRRRRKEVLRCCVSRKGE